MNGNSKTVLNFGIDEVQKGEFIAYGKIPGVPTDVVFALVNKTSNVVETVFELSLVEVDAEKAQKDIDNLEGTTTTMSPIEKEKLGVEILVGFLNIMLNEVLLNEAGASRLIIPFSIKGISESSMKEVKTGIKNADDVVLNNITRQIVVKVLASE